MPKSKSSEWNANAAALILATWHKYLLYLASAILLVSLFSNNTLKMPLINIALVTIPIMVFTWIGDEQALMYIDNNETKEEIIMWGLKTIDVKKYRAFFNLGMFIFWLIALWIVFIFS